jgi:hypothetical protein
VFVFALRGFAEARGWREGSRKGMSELALRSFGESFFNDAKASEEPTEVFPCSEDKRMQIKEMQDCTCWSWRTRFPKWNSASCDSAGRRMVTAEKPLAFEAQAKENSGFMSN